MRRLVFLGMVGERDEMMEVDSLQGDGVTSEEPDLDIMLCSCSCHLLQVHVGRSEDFGKVSRRGV
jgi:hypothetical protein